MKISRTNDFELVAKLNKYVHDLHANLYPKYFKEYNFEDMKTFFQKIIKKERRVHFSSVRGRRPTVRVCLDRINKLPR